MQADDFKQGVAWSTVYRRVKIKGMGTILWNVFYFLTNLWTQL